MDTFSAAVMLFLIMDPLGNLPVFLSILRHVDPKRRRKVMLRELLFSLVIMMGFLFAGQQILSFLNLRQEAVSIAGGIILFLIAIKMIFPSPGGVTGLAAGEEPFLVPMAIPMIAGPSILASLLLLANQEPTRMVDWSLALLMAWGASAVILMFYELFNKLLGERGLTAVERLMGMLLVMISVQMLLDGVHHYLAVTGKG
ncbi:YhgN family NAAT transporter [Aeromonas media]|uniref:YhgN family NAAT transporter n=1 Tax=Aeromonas media TaxID=651 RepID=UPI003CFDE15D